jgi:peptide deformylase
MKIYVYENSILRTKSTEVDKVDDDLRLILDRMMKVMEKANGIGLAANQIGIDKRFFVLDVEGRKLKIINPEILEFGNELIEFEEGCLSIPGVYRNVTRPEKIRVKYMDENNEVHEELLEGLISRAFQHELDHLDGVLFIDKISPLSRNLIRKKLELMKKNSIPREFDVE